VFKKYAVDNMFTSNFYSWSRLKNSDNSVNLYFIRLAFYLESTACYRDSFAFLQFIRFLYIFLSLFWTPPNKLQAHGCRNRQAKKTLEAT
jgi:hypothetical protein